MNFKKIIALICTLAIISTTASAYTPIFSEQSEQSSEAESSEAEVDESEVGQTEEENSEVDKAEDSKTEEADGEKKYTSPYLNEYDYNQAYSLFRTIMNMYVNNHLYDFTHEEVMYKFFYDMLKDNPMMFKYFTNYLLGTMDPYSSYHEKDDGFLDGDTVSTGFGITLDEDENGSTIVGSIIENTNAEKAGILAGDKFVSIMGFKVDDLTLDAVTILISNIDRFITDEQKAADEEDIVYTFEFERGGEIIPISLTRGEMVISPIASYVELHNEKEIGVITLDSFNGKDLKEKFDSILSDFSAKGIKHLTIDLRDNSGGGLDNALSMIECFIPDRELMCYYNDRTLKEPKAIYSTRKNHYTFDSIAILINEYTASASELFAHTLHVKGLAKLIGSKTYGKGIGQSVVGLTNGDYITITTYEMLDINLENYNRTGLVPDLEIESTEMFYTLPELLWFNHENYKEIKEQVYSDSAKALEDRLNIAGFLKEEYCDGIFDDTTRRALYILQLYLKLEPTGTLNDETVTKITSLINKYKTHTYYEDSPYEVSLYMHRSFSQGKRRVAEIQKIAKNEQKKIKARDKAIEDVLDEEDAAKDAAETESTSKESSEPTKNTQQTSDEQQAA